MNVNSSGIGWVGQMGKYNTVINPDIMQLTPWNIFSWLCLLESSYPKPQIILIWNMLDFFNAKY